jgi:hypothetical protein
LNCYTKRSKKWCHVAKIKTTNQWSGGQIVEIGEYRCPATIIGVRVRVFRGMRESQWSTWESWGGADNGGAPVSCCWPCLLSFPCSHNHGQVLVLHFIRDLVWWEVEETGKGRKGGEQG